MEFRVVALWRAGNDMISMQKNVSGSQKIMVGCRTAQNWKHGCGKDCGKQLTERQTTLYSHDTGSSLPGAHHFWTVASQNESCWLGLRTPYRKKLQCFCDNAVDTCCVNRGAVKPNHHHYFLSCATRKEVVISFKGTSGYLDLCTWSSL